MPSNHSYSQSHQRWPSAEDEDTVIDQSQSKGVDSLGLNYNAFRPGAIPKQRPASVASLSTCSTAEEEESSELSSPDNLSHLRERFQPTASKPTAPSKRWSAPPQTTPLLSGEDEQAIFAKHRVLLDAPLESEELEDLYFVVSRFAPPSFRFERECLSEIGRIKAFLTTDTPHARRLKLWWDTQATPEEQALAPREFVKLRWQRLGVWDPSWDIQSPKKSKKKVRFATPASKWEWKWQPESGIDSRSDKELLEQMLQSRRDLCYGEHRPVTPRADLAPDASRAQWLSFLSSRPWFTYYLEIEEESLRLERLPEEELAKITSTAPSRVRSRWQALGIWDRNWEAFCSKDTKSPYPGWKWRSETPESDPTLLCQLFCMMTARPQLDMDVPKENNPIPSGDRIWRLPPISSSDEVHVMFKEGDFANLIVIVASPDDDGRIKKTRYVTRPGDESGPLPPGPKKAYSRREKRSKSPPEMSSKGNDFKDKENDYRDKAQWALSPRPPSPSPPRRSHSPEPRAKRRETSPRYYKSNRGSHSRSRSNSPPPRDISPPESPLLDTARAEETTAPSALKSYPARIALSPRVVEAIPPEDMFRRRRKRKSSVFEPSNRWSRLLSDRSSRHDWDTGSLDRWYGDKGYSKRKFKNWLK
ncbi:hypothetical protein VHEMI09907 [[Torrubiella] hemipterigena]|uniref:Uncharacterized protein n=1 Tax=[Torrubiella] hemipterigena TaxID=1531966 RepID=A0A0A1TQW4_9HYPO|nr:hypothetical protein VHEMI09907 [[Torrubiella] hemipterigena]